MEPVRCSHGIVQVYFLNGHVSYASPAPQCISEQSAPGYLLWSGIEPCCTYFKTMCVCVGLVTYAPRENDVYKVEMKHLQYAPVTVYKTVLSQDDGPGTPQDRSWEYGIRSP
jgi:hypothetical protein